MEEKFNFENLEVYQRSLRLSIEIIKTIKGFDYKYNRIRDQLIGAIISVPLNIAEGNGRKSAKDRINFCKIARSSGFECIPLISICLELELINKAKYDFWRTEVKEICGMISGLIRYNNSKA
ncbi:MAG: four helix bundle protein [Patescibacteria group bacterium]|nr:four helix bundle protein [Patescibacteria group bacterium]